MQNAKSSFSYASLSLLGGDFPAACEQRATVFGWKRNGKRATTFGNFRPTCECPSCPLAWPADQRCPLAREAHSQAVSLARRARDCLPKQWSRRPELRSRAEDTLRASNEPSKAAFLWPTFGHHHFSNLLAWSAGNWQKWTRGRRRRVPPSLSLSLSHSHSLTLNLSTKLRLRLRPKLRLRTRRCCSPGAQAARALRFLLSGQPLAIAHCFCFGRSLCALCCRSLGAP